MTEGRQDMKWEEGNSPVFRSGDIRKDEVRKIKGIQKIKGFAIISS